MSIDEGFIGMLNWARPVFDFMLNIWDALPVEVRFVFGFFFGMSVCFVAIRTFIL